MLKVEHVKVMPGECMYTLFMRVCMLFYFSTIAFKMKRLQYFKF